MRMKQIALIGMMLLALPALAGADVIPISDVNANGEPANPGEPPRPLLDGQIVTVQGVAVVGSGTLASSTDIYIQDATGGVNVTQVGMASPVVAVGDSVRVTGRVGWATSSGRTTVRVSTDYPSTRMIVINSGNALPEPMELTPRLVSTIGDSIEGIYALIRGVSLTSGSWGNCGSSDSYAKIGDADTTCWLWFDKNTDLCGSEEPLETFEVYGVIVPDIQPSPRGGHGILPFMRSDVLSSGPGSGFVSLSPSRAFTGETYDLTFDFVPDGGELTQVTVEVPAGWEFSGDTGDVALVGPGFAGAVAVASTDLVTLTGCTLTGGSTGSLTLEGVTAPDYAGTFVFEVSTADEGSDPTAIQDQPEIGVGAQAEAGTVLINEIYAYSGGSDQLDRAEFIELYNPGAESVDLTGWVLTDISNDGNCAGTNLWEFPEGATIGGGDYLVIAKDARFQFGSGFYYVFNEYPDYELVDPYQQDLDWSNAVSPNLILVTPDDGNAAVSQEIRLAGGADGNGVIVAGVPAYDAVLLYTDRTREYLVDSVEYRNPVYLDSDPCAGAPGLGTAFDAWTPGPPPRGISLARDANSDDTDNSSVDFSLLEPTPGERNPESDTVAPTVSVASGPSHNIALVVFSEPVDPDEAVDRTHYAIGDGVQILTAELSRDGRTVMLVTTDRTPGQSYSIAVEGVSDTAGNPMDMFSGSIQFGTTTYPISTIQAYDENGLSLMAGQIVKAVGLVTVPAGVFQPDYSSMYIQEPGGEGINVFAYDKLGQPALEGDVFSATGEVEEYISSSSGAGSTTEIFSNSMTVLARGFDPVPPEVLRTGDVGLEQNEGLFVETSGTVVSVEGFAFFIDDGSGSIQIYQNFNDLDFSVFAVGDTVRMKGVILQYDQSSPFFAGYELSPRYESDMEILNGHYTGSADVEVEARVLDPSAGETIEIRYNAPRATNVTVRIFDLKGREVVTLYDGFCLGPQRMTWDGRDDEGRRVPMGVYICHVLAANRDRGNGTDASAPIVVGRKLD